VTRVVAVDWSGAASGAHHHIWLAEAIEPGRLVRLEAGRDRQQILQHLKTLLAAELFIGFDFAFSVPAWFAAEVGSRSANELWTRVCESGEAWLASCEPPFWGRPGRPRPLQMQPALRRTDKAVPRTAGIAPKSIFQIGGAGAVGTGSLRGMPLLRELHAAGARIWPCTGEGGWATVVEIYPRLLTGAVRKSNSGARAALLAAHYPDLDDEHHRLATQSEYAFDAAVSALVMIGHTADLAALPLEADPQLRLEGRIWHPGWRQDAL
jgi:hypothetical protein